MKIKLNWTHVRLWRGYFLGWLAFVAFGVVIGWRLNPRSDEIAFMLAIPFLVVVPYAALCLLIAVAKSSLAIWRENRRWSALVRQQPRKRVRRDT